VVTCVVANLFEVNSSIVQYMLGSSPDPSSSVVIDFRLESMRAYNLKSISKLEEGSGDETNVVSRYLYCEQYGRYRSAS